MNRTSSRLFAFASSLIVGGALMLGGCGPQDINDPDYLMQMRDSGIANAENQVAGTRMGQSSAQAMSDQVPQTAGTEQDLAQNAPSTGNAAVPSSGYAATGPAAVAAPAVAPVAVAAPAVVAPPPVPVVRLPPQFVRAPDLVSSLPPNVVLTGEQRNFEQDINHYREIRVLQPNINRHNINNTLLRRHRYATRVINMPSQATVITTTGNTVFAQEVLPTEVITLPVAITPPIYAAPPVPIVPVRPICGAPFFGRGNFFSCNRGW